MNRRAFIQGLIGLASMPALSKFVNVFKPSAVREGITQAADNTMSKGIEFYEAVIKRVMDEGTVINEADRFRTYKHPDKPDMSVEVNLSTGDTAVYFDTDRGSKAAAEISTDIEMGPGAPKELMESEEVYRMGGDDYYKDLDEEITGGVGSLEEWIKMKRGYAAGGRVGMFRGGIPKGLAAALRTIRSKFGDDSITTADEIKRPQNIVEAEETAQAIKDFNLRNPRPYKTGDAITEENFESTGFAPDLSGLEKAKKLGLSEYPIWENPEKVREAVDDIFPTGDYKYDAQMAAEALVENNPDAFANKLFDDLDQRTQMKVYGAVVDVVQQDLTKMLQMKKLSKPTKTLEAMKAGKGIDISDPVIAEEFTRFMKENDPKGFKDVEEKVELMNFDPKGRKKNADGGSVDGDVSLTVIEIPDISKSGVESLFKRR